MLAADEALGGVESVGGVGDGLATSGGTDKTLSFGGDGNITEKRV